MTDTFGGDPCADALRALHHYVDGELTGERRAVVAAHLDACGACVDVFAVEVHLRRLIGSHCRDTVPDHLRRRIADALAAAVESPLADGDGRSWSPWTPTSRRDVGTPSSDGAFGGGPGAG